jgi:hypothetical protein
MVELYSANGVQYWVDPQNNVVRYMLLMGPSVSVLTEDTDAEYSIQESEVQARDFLERNCICFKDVKDELKFQVAEKSIEGVPGIRFFRWEVTSDVKDVDVYNLPPFIQVGISSTGVMVSYADFVCAGQQSLQGQ